VKLGFETFFSHQFVEVKLGTDVTQTKITSYRIENFFSVGRTDLAVVILETSEFTLSF
jgi:hypothetical protein